MGIEILCYHGSTSKATSVQEPRRESDFINYLYHPASRIVILECPKGTTISAYKHPEINQEYLEGERIIVKKEEFSKLVDLCVKESELRDSALEQFSKCLEN